MDQLLVNRAIDVHGMARGPEEPLASHGDGFSMYKNNGKRSSIELRRCILHGLIEIYEYDFLSP